MRDTELAMAQLIPRRRKLHPKQVKLLDILEKHQEDPLSGRDLQAALGISSLSVVQHHLRMLERNGYLKRNPSDPRHYVVVGSEPENPVVQLPVFGMVQCGPKGSVIEGEPIDRIPVASRMLPYSAEQLFLVKARGHSMEPKIAENDLVLVRKSSTPENGNLVVCVNKGEAMIKKFQKEPKQGIILKSINSEYDPLIANTKDFRVEGVVVGVFSYKL